MGATYVMGDVHGHYDELLALLCNGVDGHKLIDADNHWIGEDATLCFVGDYFDRGPDGLGVVNLIMQLEQEAAQAGGAVHALLGNHDVFILAAHRYRNSPVDAGGRFFMDWLAFGGQIDDIDGLTDAHVAWLQERPAMLNLNNRLIMHADALFYVNYGNSITRVNKAISDILKNGTLREWARLSEDFIERFTFYPRTVLGGSRGIERAWAMLGSFGGEQIIHGHTPISVLTGQKPHQINQPLIYANALCVDVDGGIYQGSPGFLHRIPD